MAGAAIGGGASGGGASGGVGSSVAAAALSRLGAALDVETDNGKTCAALAAANGHNNMLLLLHSLGADLDIRNTEPGIEATPSNIAAQHGHTRRWVDAEHGPCDQRLIVQHRPLDLRLGRIATR